MRVTMAGQVQLQARFTVDRTLQPHGIDYLLGNGSLQHGRYELDGAELKVVFAAPGCERPADFSTGKNDGKTLTTWRLAKQ
jgi:uncharacterized protein (TIGR03067 family)